MSTSRNTGTNHKGKTVQTFNFVTFSCLSFFSKLGYSQNTEHNDNKHFSVFSTILLLRICWMPRGHRARVVVSRPPQISYPCWALQSNTERNLPFTFSVFFTYIFSCSLRITFFPSSRKLHQSLSIQLVRIFNNIQTFSNHIYIPVSFLVRIKRSTIQLLFRHFSFLSH